MVSRCYPAQCLALHGVLLYAVNYLLLRIVTGYRVVTLLHNPDFGVPFIIKVLDGELSDFFYKIC